LDEIPQHRHPDDDADREHGDEGDGDVVQQEQTAEDQAAQRVQQAG
jgi:hypothetical protein